MTAHGQRDMLVPPTPGWEDLVFKEPPLARAGALQFSRPFSLRCHSPGPAGQNSRHVPFKKICLLPAFLFGKCFFFSSDTRGWALHRGLPGHVPPVGTLQQWSAGFRVGSTC